MFRRAFGIVFLMFCCALTACSTTTRGPASTLGINGPSSPDAQKGLAKSFVDSESKSFADQSNAELAETMLSDGFDLVYGNCSEFFSSAGETQKWVIVARDAIGVIGTLGTSVLALHNGSKNAVANLALGTGLSFSALDIYTKNFLFSAENIDSVRTLVTNALSAHKKVVLTQTPFTYQSATIQILDTQDICTPAAISALARAAIKKGDVAASVTGSGDGTSVRQLGDQAVLHAIGTILNPPGPVTSDQAGALWWLLKDFSTDAQKSKLIAPKLAELPATSKPFDSAGAYQSGWKFADTVGQALDRLSSETKESFRTAIVAAKATAGTSPVVAGAPAPALAARPVPAFSLASPSRSPKATHVTVGIR